MSSAPQLPPSGSPPPQPNPFIPPSQKSSPSPTPTSSTSSTPVGSRSPSPQVYPETPSVEQRTVAIALNNVLPSAAAAEILLSQAKKSPKTYIIVDTGSARQIVSRDESDKIKFSKTFLARDVASLIKEQNALGYKPLNVFSEDRKKALEQVGVPDTPPSFRTPSSTPIHSAVTTPTATPPSTNRTPSPTNETTAMALNNVVPYVEAAEVLLKESKTSKTYIIVDTGSAKYVVSRDENGKVTPSKAYMALSIEDLIKQQTKEGYTPLNVFGEDRKYAVAQAEKKAQQQQIPTPQSEKNAKAGAATPKTAETPKVDKFEELKFKLQQLGNNAPGNFVKYPIGTGMAKIAFVDKDGSIGEVQLSKSHLESTWKARFSNGTSKSGFNNVEHFIKTYQKSNIKPLADGSFEVTPILGGDAKIMTREEVIKEFPHVMEPFVLRKEIQ